MKIDVSKPPLGEALVTFLFAAVAVTFVLAFIVPTGGPVGEQAVEDEAVAELSPTPLPSPVTPTPGAPSPELVQRGQELATANACLTCHSTTGEVIIGPSWKGLFGRDEALTGGGAVTVDGAYIRESVLNPRSKVVQGFDPLMPSFSVLTEQDIEAVIAFIQSLR